MGDFGPSLKNSNYKILISESFEDAEWDHFVNSAPGGHHVQTTWWAETKWTLGWRTIRLVIKNVSGIIGGAQILIHDYPIIGPLGYITKGPLFMKKDESVANWFIGEIMCVAREKRLRLLSVQPPNNAGYICGILEDYGFRQEGLEITPTASILLDLTLDIEHLFGQMKRQTRQNVSRSLKAGIRIEEGGEGDIEHFYDLYRRTSQRQKFLPYKKEYYKAMMTFFRPHGNFQLLFSKHEEEPVSVLLLIPFQDTVIAKIFGWSGKYREQRPNEGLFWGAILWSKQHGYKYLDLEGIDRIGAEKLLKNEQVSEAIKHTPDQLKYGFGGKIMLYPESYDVFSSRICKWIFSAVRPSVAKKTIAARMIDRFRKR